MLNFSELNPEDYDQKRKLFRSNSFVLAHSSAKKIYKLQVLRNKCIRFCLQLDNREHIGTEHFDKINWLPIDQRFKQCLSTSAFKFSSEMCPQYMNEIYETINQNKITRNSRKLIEILL